MSAPDNVMSRVMKLLALANDESASPHERKLAEERAERLMAQHLIDRFEASQKLHNGVRRPIMNEWEVMLSDAATQEGMDRSDFDYQVIGMMYYVLEHCNVRVDRNFRYGRGARSRIYQIVGFQEDIAYAERIWFNVFKTFVNNVNPKWDLSKSIEYNAYNFASAGVSWKNQVLIAETAGDTRIAWPWRYHNNINKSDNFYTRYEWQVGEAIDPGNKPWGQSIHKLKRACKKYCDDNFVAYPYAAGSKLRVASRNSFARSYRATIQDRLDEIRKEALRFHDPMGDMPGGVNQDKYALAVRDTKERVDEEFYRLFPHYHPDAQAKAAEEREFLRACAWASLPAAEKRKVLREEAKEEERWERQRERARRNYGSVREDPAHRYDGAAWERGTKAAKTVNLRADEEVDNTTAPAKELR